MTTTRTTLRRLVAGSTGLRGLFTGTASDSATKLNSTTLLVDASADGLKDSAYDEDRFDDTYAYLCHASSPEWHRLINGTYSPAEGTLTPGRTMATAATTGTTEYELHTHGLTPDELHDAINWACRNAVYPVYWHLTGLLEANDGSMEATTAASWTGSSATVTKVTAAATVAFDQRSLSVANTGANGYAASAALPVSEQKQYRVSGYGRCTVGTASLVVRDRTNSADITVSWSDLTSLPAADATDWRHLLGVFTAPEGCVSIEVRLTNSSATGVTYWDNVRVQPTDARYIDLPSWLTDPERDILDVFTVRPTNTGRLDAALVKLRPCYAAVGNPSGVTPWVLPVPPTDRPLVILAARTLGDLSADTDTVPDWMRDWLVAGALSRAYEMGARPRALDDRAVLLERERTRSLWERLSLFHSPHVRYGRPVRSTYGGAVWA